MDQPTAVATDASFTPASSTTPPIFNRNPRKSNAGRYQGIRACFACQDKKQKCDEVRPACGACAREKVDCGYAFVAEVRRQHGMEQALRKELGRVQSEADCGREQLEAPEKQLHAVQNASQQQKTQPQALQNDLLQCRAIVQSLRDQQQQAQNVSQAVIERQQDPGTIASGSPEEGNDLLRFASLVESLRSRPKADADFLLHALRLGQYDWALIETLDWLRGKNAMKLYPWHDWRMADNFIDGQHTMPRDNTDKLSLPKSGSQHNSKLPMSHLPSPSPDPRRSTSKPNSLPKTHHPKLEASEPPLKKRSLNDGGAWSVPSSSSNQSLPCMSIKQLLAPNQDEAEDSPPASETRPSMLLYSGDGSHRDLSGIHALIRDFESAD